MIITYDENSTTNLFADGNVIDGVSQLIRIGEDFTVSQCIVIDAIRILVKRGLLNCREFEINFMDANGFNNEIYVNKDGRISSWPSGFSDKQERFFHEFLDY